MGAAAVDYFSTRLFDAGLLTGLLGLVSLGETSLVAAISQDHALEGRFVQCDTGARSSPRARPG